MYKNDLSAYLYCMISVNPPSRSTLSGKKEHQALNGPSAHWAEMARHVYPNNAENGRDSINRNYDGQSHENGQSLSPRNHKFPTPSGSLGHGVTRTSQSVSDLITEIQHTVRDPCASDSDTSLQLSTHRSSVGNGSTCSPGDSFAKDDLDINVGSNHASINREYANGFVSTSDIGTDVPSAGQSHEMVSNGTIGSPSNNNSLDLISSISCSNVHHPSLHSTNASPELSGSGSDSRSDSVHDPSSFHLDSLSGMSLHMSGFSAANQQQPDAIAVLVPSSDLQDEGLASVSHAISFPEPSDPSSGSYPSHPPAGDNVAVQGAMYVADSMPELNLLSGSGNGSDSENSHSSCSSGKHTQSSPQFKISPITQSTIFRLDLDRS